MLTIFSPPRIPACDLRSTKKEKKKTINPKQKKWQSRNYMFSFFKKWKMKNSMTFLNCPNLSKLIHTTFSNTRSQLKSLCINLITIMGFPGSSEVKASACNVGDLGSIPGSGRSPGEGNGNPLQYSCLENPMEPGRLQSMGSQTVGYDWATSLSLSTLLVGITISESVGWTWHILDCIHALYCC